MPLLVAIKPENERTEKERFLRASFNYNPLFLYRSPAEPEALGRFVNPSDKYISQVSIYMAVIFVKVCVNAQVCLYLRVREACQ